MIHHQHNYFSSFAPIEDHTMDIENCKEWNWPTN